MVRNILRRVVTATTCFSIFAIGNAMADNLSVQDAGNIWTVEQGQFRVSIDKQTGGLKEVVCGTKIMVGENRLPPITATLMESEEWDGRKDASSHSIIPGTFVLQDVRAVEEKTTLEVAGRLEFGGGDALNLVMGWKIVPEAGRVGLSLTVQPEGSFNNRFLRELSIPLPLNLAFRKRVIQAGDQGLWWNTRHYYQFHASHIFLTTPEANWWRYFFVDQQSPANYRIWRSEGEDTSGLEFYRGQQAAGWMAMYDESGGLLFALRDMAERTPACLFADAALGGRAVVYLQGPTHAARAVSDPATGQSLFSKPHEIEFLFFEGDPAETRPDQQLAEIWGMDQSPGEGDGRPNAVADDEGLWSVPQAAPADLSPMVAGGISLPRGVLRDPDAARVFIEGREVPLQTRTLAYWPDKSVKWLLLIFPLQQQSGAQIASGSGGERDFQFKITLRNGEPLPGVLRVGPDVRSAAAKQSLVADTDEDGAVTIDTGSLALKLVTGDNWLDSALLHGREMIRKDGRAQAVVDFFRPTENYFAGSTHPVGVMDPGPVVIEKLELEESGPMRAVVRLEGLAQAQEPARVILRLEAYAGRPWMRILHTVEFMQKDPREVFVQKISLRIPLAQGGQDYTVAAGLQDGVVELKNPPAAGLRQTAYNNLDLWRTAAGGTYQEIMDRAAWSRGWLGSGNENGGAVFVVRDMWQEAPKEISYQAAGNVLEAHLWPESVPLMDVRRYSNYPHPAQGESAPSDYRWVLDYYYKNDPFAGVSKSHELLLVFQDSFDAEQCNSMAADFQSRPLLYAGWKHYADCGITMPLAPMNDAGFEKFNENMSDTADWWLHHQRKWGWYGLWDYGDVRHGFRTGYGKLLKPDDLAEVLSLPEGERKRDLLDNYKPVQDYFAQNDWTVDNGRWGWSNTEGLVNHFMSLQYMRSGQRDVFFFMEANARHSRDVDARHSGKWFGLGTRHGVQHWSDGNHEVRQTTFTEQRFHYLLTGEDRTREWLQQLTEDYYLKGSIWRSAAHSGRSYGILTWWEVSGDDSAGETVRNYMHSLAQPEGLATDAHVKFPSGELSGPLGKLHGMGMFFHTFGGMHAVLEYYYITGDERIKQSILASAAYVLEQNTDLPSWAMALKVVAFAARHAPDPEPYRAMLERWITGPGKERVFRLVPYNRELWGGTGDRLASSVVGTLFWLSDAFYTLGALPAEPQLEKRKWAGFADDDRVNKPRSRVPRDSWQSEYDRPEFREYFRETMQPHLKPE